MSPEAYGELLFSSDLSQAKLGDHVTEVLLRVPAWVTAITVSDKAEDSNFQGALLRAYARDLTCLSGSRFAPLSGSTIVCKNEPVQLCKTEVVLTNYVVLRGRYQSIAVQLYGKPLKKPAPDPAEDETGVAAGAPPGQDPWSLALDSHELNPAPPPVLPRSGALPLAALPPRAVHAVTEAVGYYDEVRRYPGHILRHPPGARLRRMRSVADAVLATLNGSASGQQDFLLRPGRAHGAGSAAEWQWQAVERSAVDMAVAWCGLLAQQRCAAPLLMEVAMAGLDAALLLAACPHTAPLFLAKGGAVIVLDVLSIASPAPRLVKAGVALCELLTLSAGPLALESLMRAYTPVAIRPPPVLLPGSQPPPPPARPRLGPGVGTGADAEGPDAEEEAEEDQGDTEDGEGEGAARGRPRVKHEAATEDEDEEPGGSGVADEEKDGGGQGDGSRSPEGARGDADLPNGEVKAGNSPEAERGEGEEGLGGDTGEGGSAGRGSDKEESRSEGGSECGGHSDREGGREGGGGKQEGASAGGDDGASGEGGQAEVRPRVPSTPRGIQAGRLRSGGRVITVAGASGRVETAGLAVGAW